MGLSRLAGPPSCKKGETLALRECSLLGVKGTWGGWMEVNGGKVGRILTQLFGVPAACSVSGTAPITVK